MLNWSSHFGKRFPVHTVDDFSENPNPKLLKRYLNTWNRKEEKKEEQQRQRHHHHNNNNNTTTTTTTPQQQQQHQQQQVQLSPAWNIPRECALIKGEKNGWFVMGKKHQG